MIERLKEQAAAVLTDFIDDRPGPGARKLMALTAEFGWPGVRLAMLYWCDALGEHMCDGPMGRRKVTGMFIVDAGTGGLVDIDDDDAVGPEVRWAVGMIEARLSMDRLRWERSIAALPDDDARLGDHVVTLARVIGATMAALPRGMGLNAEELAARED